MPESQETPMKARNPIHEYVYQIPGPPSIWIPSPVVENAEELSIHESASYDYNLTGFANVDFLKTVNHTNFNAPQSVLDWNHQQRWTAQVILPFLYLGPTSVIRDDSFLRNHGITMILRIRIVLTSGSKSLDIAVANPAIEIETIDVEGTQDLIAAFPRGIDMINAHMSKLFNKRQQTLLTSGPLITSPSGSVLVCCETGNERSPCMIAAYLMAMYAMDFVKAIQIVQAQRFSAAIGEESKTILRTYHSILEAQRSVIRSNTTDFQRNLRKAVIDDHAGQTNKRSLDDLYDDEMDISIDYISRPGLPIGTRQGQAPFQDGEGS